MRNLDPKRAKWIRFRMAVLSGVMGLGLGGFVASAYRVQVEDGDAWRAAAEKQRERRQQVKPKRGSIFDRHGHALAVSVEVPSASIDVTEMLQVSNAKEVKSPDEVTLRDASQRLAQVLSLDANELFARLSMKKRFLWLKRRISGDEATALRDLGDPKKQIKPIHGISIDAESRRFYPSRELAGTLLGFVSPDGEGKDGLELALDEDLRGKPEEVEGLRDRQGRLLAVPGKKAPLGGANVELTLDEGIQHIAEAELAGAQGTYEIIGGSVVIMDPQTGEILGMASTPGFNPNDYNTSDVEARRDRAVADRFEPGSVMKVFTVAGALAAGKITRDEKIFCEHGTFKLGPVTIHDTHLNDWLDVREILQKSSNIGALKIGLTLGEAELYATYRRFGFGEPSGIPLPGEATGVLRPRGRPWFDVETANASFGQGISVTALQLATATSAIASDGKLLEPVLVRRISDGNGNTIREAPVPHVRREAVPASVAAVLREMLVSVTEKGGTAEEAAIPGFRVAGKTATAQKVDPTTGKYSTEKFTASFVGMVPAEKPRLVIAVVLDEPTIGHYGGDLAGPVFRRIGAESLRYLGIVPSDHAEKLPAAIREAAPVASQSGQLVRMEGPTVVRVPDVSGMVARDAVKKLTEAGLVPSVIGSGKLTRQSLQPGSTVPKGTGLQLVFEPVK